MEGNDSTLDKNTVIIGKLSKEIKILKRTIKEFRKNKVYPFDIRISVEELFRLKGNLDYHLKYKGYNFLNMMRARPLPNFRTNFRINDDTMYWSFENSHLPGLG